MNYWRLFMELSSMLNMKLCTSLRSNTTLDNKSYILKLKVVWLYIERIKKVHTSVQSALMKSVLARIRGVKVWRQDTKTGPFKKVSVSNVHGNYLYKKPHREMKKGNRMRLDDKLMSGWIFPTRTARKMESVVLSAIRKYNMRIGLLWALR